MEIEAIAAPAGAACRTHPQSVAVFQCSRCGDFGCERCAAVVGGEAGCARCAEEIALPLPAALWPRLRFLYLSLDGRVNRKTWWLYVYVPMLVFQLMCIAIALLAPSNGVLLGLLGLGSMCLIWPVFAMSIKRVHDRGHSGWHLLFGLIPVVGGFWMFAVLGFLRGDGRANRYGRPTI